MAALVLLGPSGGLSAQRGGRKPRTGGGLSSSPRKNAGERQKGRKSKDKAEDYLRAAVLDREIGHLKTAFDWCWKIKKEFPDDRKVTPRALLMGGEILLELNKPMNARFWTTDAIRRFRDLPDYQKRIAVLHRLAIARVTYLWRNRPRHHIAQYCLILQWSVRGLSGDGIRARYDRFWEEIRRHKKDWERPGKEKEKGREGYPPSGMGRVMEWLTAALTRDVFAARGKKVKALDELVPLLERRIRDLRGLWASPTPDPRALEDFDRLMDRMWDKFDEFWKATRSMVTFHIPRKSRKSSRKKEKPLSSMSRKELEAEVKSMRRRIKALEREIKALKAKNKEKKK